MIYHDVKNHMTVISERTSMLSGSHNPDFIRHVAAIQRASDSVLELIEDCQNYQEVAEGKTRIPLSKMNVIDVLRNVLGQLQYQMNQAKIRPLPFPTGNQAVPCMVIGNAAILSRVFFNVIHNAIRHSQPHAKIAVTFKTKKNQDSSHVVVFISDQGCGISKRDWANVFHPHFRLNSHVEGQGLGLTIAKELLVLIGGNIGIYRSELGKGTTFYIRLVSP